LGDRVIDDAYGRLQRGSDGKAEVRLADPVSGTAVTVWMDESFDWVHIYTSDGLEGDRRRGSVAIEPTTCPPNALASGDDLIELAPTGAWFGVRGLRPDAPGPFPCPRRRGAPPSASAKPETISFEQVLSCDDAPADQSCPQAENFPL